MRWQASKNGSVSGNIHATGGMPEHRFLAIFSVFKVDAITHQVLPEALKRKALMEKTHHWEGLQSWVSPKDRFWL